MKDLKIKNLYVYPIKSCKGLKVSTVNVEKIGFRYDRYFAVMNSKNEILTARENSELLHISADIDKDIMRLSRHGVPSTTIDVTKGSTDNVDVNIFNNPAKAKIVNLEADVWLSQTLQEKCRLISIDSNQLRSE